MSSIIQPILNGGIPEFLTIVNVTRDVHIYGSFSLGGTVTFAALTAYHLGLAAAIVTCVEEQLLAELPELLPGIGLGVRTSPTTTTFINQYTDGFRVQYLHNRAESLRLTDIPLAWR